METLNALYNAIEPWWFCFFQWMLLLPVIYLWNVMMASGLLFYWLWWLRLGQVVWLRSDKFWLLTCLCIISHVTITHAGLSWNLFYSLSCAGNYYFHIHDLGKKTGLINLSIKRIWMVIYTYWGLVCCNFVWFFNSATRVHPPSYLRNGCHLSSEIWDGENCCLCSIDSSADWTCGWSSCCSHSLSHKRTCLPGMSNDCDSRLNDLWWCYSNQNDFFVWACISILVFLLAFSILYFFFLIMFLFFYFILFLFIFFYNFYRSVMNLRGSVPICPTSGLLSSMVVSVSRFTRIC